jgi:erythrin-vacuolar iron transport family protein
VRVLLGARVVHDGARVRGDAPHQAELAEQVERRVDGRQRELREALGRGDQQGLSEALSDDGTLTGRGRAAVRGTITGVATFVGGSLHALPFLIADVRTALKVAYVVVAIELVVIALVRKRYLQVSLYRSLIQVTLGGVIVAFVGFAIGHA